MPFRPYEVYVEQKKTTVREEGDGCGSIVSDPTAFQRNKRYVSSLYRKMSVLVDDGSGTLTEMGTPYSSTWYVYASVRMMCLMLWDPPPSFSCFVVVFLFARS